jgi:hypothetical protein
LAPLHPRILKINVREKFSFSIWMTFCYNFYNFLPKRNLVSSESAAAAATSTATSTGSAACNGSTAFSSWMTGPSSAPTPTWSRLNETVLAEIYGFNLIWSKLKFVIITFL